jgi:pimeloyl-ACP methyl ester carboxylesterase
MAPYDGLPNLHAPAKAWVERIFPESEVQRLIRFVTFSLAESQACPSFREFGSVLKAKIRAVVPPGSPIDLVCHSMGSLDAMAAILQDPDPLRPVVNLICAASPIQGIFYGLFVPAVDALSPILNWQPYHYVQVRNMNSDAAPMRWLNALETRRRLLDRVRALWTMGGTQDMVVMRSAKFRTEGLSVPERRQVRHLAIAGAMHIGPAGITQDPRTVSAALRIVMGLPWKI